MTRLHGLDTETPEANVALIATEDEWIEPHSFDDIAQFVLQSKYRGTYFFTFNLRFDAQAMLKLLPEDLQQDIWYTGDCEYNGLHIKYIDKKFLRILKRNRQSANIYDIAPYYQGHSLDSASKQFLGEKKLDTIDRKKLGESYGYYAAHRDEIIKYCMHDAWLTKELGKVTQKDFVKLGFGFDRPLSTANIMGRWIKDNTAYPKRDVWDRHIFAFMGYRGGRFETRQRGLFDEPLYDYDINSAYPSTMVELPNWGNGEFIEVVEPGDNEYGWYKCRFDCPHIPHVTKVKWTFTDYLGDEEKISQAKNSRILYPTGVRELCITKLEYDWMKKYNYPCEFLAGVEWEEQNGKYAKPFGFVGNLYERRKEIKHDPKQFSLQYNMKICMNASYGKTGEYKNGFGIIQNFYYASYITAATRMRMATVIQEHPGAVVNVAADGILSREKIPELKISKELGDWEVNEYDGGVVVGSGILQLFGENGRTKARGITDRRNWDLIGELKNNRDKEYVTYTRHSPASLGMVLSWPKVLKMSDLNRFLDFSRRLYVNTDRNHIWDQLFKNWGEFLESKGHAKPYDWEVWESENLPRK